MDKSILKAGRESPEARFVGGPGLRVSQCISCVHKRRDGGACDAFPSGIPRMILENKFDHKNPFPGDGGIRYEAKGS